MYKLFIRPFLFCFDPEKVHYFSFLFIKIISRLPFVQKILTTIYEVNDSRLERTVFGLKFKNPVGLAAGFDKDAKILEIGTYTGISLINIIKLIPNSIGCGLDKWKSYEENELLTQIDNLQVEKSFYNNINWE